MKKTLWLLSALVCAVACMPSAEERAAAQMRQIDSLYRQKEYLKTLNAIRRLRADHPQAVEARRRALEIWQEASLKMAREDIARTDSALQAVTRDWEAETDLGRRNRLGVCRDSLQVRYDALCGTVRVILRRQKEG